MEDIKELDRIGLTKNERSVYLTLIEVGISTVGNLMKKTRLHRSYIYDILDKLIDLGLAGFTIKNNKRYFEAVNPERIMQILVDREQEIVRDKKEISKILPSLIKKQTILTEQQEARIFMGKNGIKTILEDILKTKKSLYSFVAEGKFKENFGWYFENWNLRRTKLNIKHKIVYSEIMKGKRPVKEQKLIEVKFIPKEYKFPASTLIYGDKIALITWEVNPLAFLLKSKSVVKSFRNYFDLLWEIAEE